MKHDFILASASPRRKEILMKAGYLFQIIPSEYDEKVNGLIYTDDLIENCAFQKALEVKNRIKSDIPIVSADTVVVFENVILGKPQNKDEAVETLLKLSNNTHFVATSICILTDDLVIKYTQKTNVSFKKISLNDAIKYVEIDNPLDKAGSYGIQDKNFKFIDNIQGEYDNVVGFPLKLFQEKFRF